VTLCVDGRCVSISTDVKVVAVHRPEHHFEIHAFLYVKIYYCYNYRKTQWYRESGQQPLRCSSSQALFGHNSSLVIIVPSDSEDIATILRERGAK